MRRGLSCLSTCGLSGLELETSTPSIQLALLFKIRLALRDKMWCIKQHLNIYG